MATAAATSTPIALCGAPDSDIGSKDAKHTPIQAMYLEISRDIVDELLDSARSGRTPQILFGRTPQLKYGDKSHILETTSENFRYELYQSSGAGSDNELTFTGLINHSLAVQKAEEVTSAVDSALEQLKSSMAAMAEMKEANKTVVGESSPMYTPGHRRFPSKNLKSQHLKPSSNLNSPLRTNPSSPAMSLPAHMTSGSTRKAAGDRSDQVQALRHVIIHLISMEHLSEDWIVEQSRSSHSAVHEILPKLAKKDEAGKYFLTDKAFKDLDPYNFPYKTDEDRQKTIDNSIRAFDRLRLPKDDKLWQILLPQEERGKGKCLSRLNVQAPAAQTKPSTPLHKIKATEKKAASSQKSDDKDGAKEGKKPKEVEPKKTKVTERKKAKEVEGKATKEIGSGKTKESEAKKAKETEFKSTREIKEKKPVKTSAEKVVASSNLSAAKTGTSSVTEPAKARKKVAAAPSAAAPRPRPKAATRDVSAKERVVKPGRSSTAANTKPKNPSPLSVSPPVNASDFENDHPVHKALSAAPSPAKNSQSSNNSDRSLKRKANDLDSNTHDHHTKQPRRDLATPGNTPTVNGKANGTTPSSGKSLKRRAADDSSTANTTPASKYRKVTSIDTVAASRYQTNKASNVISPGESSSATTSPSIPSLSFRQTVELSQKFQKYYKKYEELYWKLADSKTPPTEAQRDELMKMHTKLEDMKREIKAGANTKH